LIVVFCFQYGGVVVEFLAAEIGLVVVFITKQAVSFKKIIQLVAGTVY
jgi:hypothetical protein